MANAPDYYESETAITARANAALTGNYITLIMVGLDVVAALIGLGALYLLQALRSRRYQALSAVKC